MWTPPILLVLAIAQVVLGDAIFELQLIQFHNPAGKDERGKCCESIYSWTCSSGDPSNCDPELTICVDYPYSTECTTNKSRSTGMYRNTHSITFGSHFESGVSNPMKFRIIPWKSAVNITITVYDIDDGLGGSNDFMGETWVIFEENLVDQLSGGTWYDMTFTYNEQTITAKARAYCVANYYGTNCTGYCKAKDDVINGHYTCANDGSKVCLEYYYGESCKVRCQPIHGNVRHVSCDENGTAICVKGWVGVNCSEDINECLNATDNPCYPHRTCYNYNGSYSCAYEDAYTDEGTIYLKGYLRKKYYDELRDGIRLLLGSLNITDADIRTTVTYPDQKKTRVDIFVESSNPDISGSLHKLFYPTTADQRQNVNNNLPLPLTDHETTPVPDPWVKHNWYVIVMVVAIITLFAVIAACHILGKRRIALMKKSGFDHDRSANNVTESLPDATLYVDNNIYSELNYVAITEKF